jgi:phage FluMu protein Com
MSLLDQQTADFQYRAMTGRIRPQELAALPECPMPPPYATRKSLNETVDIVAKAITEHFRIDTCRKCGGVEVFSKRYPWARCTRCGTCRAFTGVAPLMRRTKCRACGKLFRSVTQYLKCPACREKAPPEPEQSPTRIKRREEP